MFLRCSYFLAKSEADVLINSVLIKRKACILLLNSKCRYSYNKAQQLGIRSARLDLDNYLTLTRQKLPYLAFSDVFNVMADARDTDGNWPYAFQNIITG